MDASIELIAKLGRLSGDAAMSVAAVVLVLVVMAYWILKT
jgi:hypothetical protein